MDVLTSVLSAMKLTGSVFLEAEFTAPWCVASQLLPEDCAAYFPLPEHVISYHYVIAGQFQCRVAGGEPVDVHAGQILVVPRGLEHHIGSSLSAAPVRARDLVVPPEEGGLARICFGGGGEAAVMLCGFMGTATPVNSFMLSLPEILVIDAAAGAGGEWLVSSLHHASRETLTGSPELVSRLAELLFVQAIRQYIAELPEDRQGWFAGLRDPHVSQAMTLLHTRCAEAWATEALAREVGLSRSALAERFSHYLGEPPMRYLAKWRMNRAAGLMREERQNAANVAYEVGFNSEAAFNRAFKKEFGSPPATWRRERCAA